MTRREEDGQWKDGGCWVLDDASEAGVLRWTVDVTPEGSEHLRPGSHGWRWSERGHGSCFMAFASVSFGG